MISMSLPRNYCYENKIMQFVVACILIATLSLPVNASVGGHDLFTSLAQLEVWTSRRKNQPAAWHDFRALRNKYPPFLAEKVGRLLKVRTPFLGGDF